MDVGSSFLPSEMAATSQLEARSTIQSQREAIWHRYEDGLADWAAASRVLTPQVPAGRQQAFHMYYMLMPSLDGRQRVNRHLENERESWRDFLYLPLHLSLMGRGLGYSEGDCPVTEDVCDRLLRLPFFTGLTPDQQGEVIAAVRSAEV